MSDTRVVIAETADVPATPSRFSRSPTYQPVGGSKLSDSTAAAKKQWLEQGSTLVYDAESKVYLLAGAVRKRSGVESW